MDTDELSKESYDGIILEAEKYSHDLTMHFGQLSYECENEQEFLNKSIELINELKNCDPGDITDIFFWEEQNISKLNKALDKILKNIAKINVIPMEKRLF